MYIDDTTVEIVRQSLIVALKISAPILVAGILIGLAISVLQSITQIQEQTLTIVPKIFVMTIVAILLLPWIVLRIAEFTVDMFSLAPGGAGAGGGM